MTQTVSPSHAGEDSPRQASVSSARTKCTVDPLKSKLISLIIYATITP